jgi:hypothetical protein
MGGKNHGAPSGWLLVDDVIDGLRRMNIQPCEGFIHQQQAVFLGYGLRDKHSLPLASREPKYLAIS